MKIYIEKKFISQSVSVFAIKEGSHQDSFYYMENGELKERTVEHPCGESEIKPLLVLPYKFYEVFEHALIEEANSMNRKTENHHKLEGTLAATIKHLDDLRVIVFSKYDDRPEIQKYKNKE